MTRYPLTLAEATLPFYRYRDAEGWVIEFDSSGCRCPVPMHNAMVGLERIAQSGERLVMINGFEPEGLYERVRDHFDWRVRPLDDGRVKVTFSAHPSSAALDFSNRHCHGG